MKIFSSSQIRDIDRYTIEQEPIPSIDLMERAADQLFNWISGHYDQAQSFLLLAGPGNNGGDALALARMMAEAGYRPAVILADLSGKRSDDCETNLARLREQGKVEITLLKKGEKIPAIPGGMVLVDGLFGSGLTRPLEGWITGLVDAMNRSGNEIIAIDIPSGIFGEEIPDGGYLAAVQAATTLGFQFPKLAFLLPENEKYVGKWEVLPIGLHPQAIESTETPWRLVSSGLVADMLHNRKKFAHKGHFGHALLIAGCYGKMGAAVLGARACLRAGAGLLTVHIPRFGYEIIQTAVPEAMVSIDQSDILFSEVPDPGAFTAIGIGPGLGCRNNSHEGIRDLLDRYSGPLVMDADAVNILGQHPEWMEKLPGQTILTPHPGEFGRITESGLNSWQRLVRLRELTSRFGIHVVLKGAYTAIGCPDGTVWFNPTGNPGMATAGSGDALTGIILSLLAQGYNAREAAILGVYLHGLAGDLGAREKGQESLIAGDIIDFLGEAFKNLHDEKQAK